MSRPLRILTHAGSLEPLGGIETCTLQDTLALTGRGLELREIAPGVDLDRDVVGQMEFRPLVAENLRVMDQRFFERE